MPKEPNINFRWDDDHTRRFKAMATLRGHSYTDVLRELAQMWLDEQSAAPGQRHRGGYPARDRRWHDDLQIILDDPAERPGIEANIRWGSEAVRRKQTDPPQQERPESGQGQGSNARPTGRVSGL